MSSVDQDRCIKLGLQQCDACDGNRPNGWKCWVSWYECELAKVSDVNIVGYILRDRAKRHKYAIVAAKLIQHNMAERIEKLILLAP